MTSLRIATMKESGTEDECRCKGEIKIDLQSKVR